MSFDSAQRVNPNRFTGREGFDPSQHPRAADGTFTEKTGSAPEVGLSGEVHVSDAAVDAYTADREARKKPKTEPRASKSGAFGAMHTLHDVDQAFAALSSPENLFMDGEVGREAANRRYAHYAAGYVARAAEVANDGDYHAAVQQSVDVMLGAGRPSRTNDGIVIHAKASGMGADATLFSGGKPNIEASGRDTVVITKTRGGTVKVPAGSNPTIIVGRYAMTSIEV